MLNINPYLERFIFDELKAQYDPDPIAALHNLDNNEQQSQRYLGTYFPRSFVESYNIFYRLFNQEEIYKNFIGKKKINILNIGSGSGGDLFGLIEAMKDFFPLETIMTNIISIDGNVNAVSYQKKIYEQLYQNSNNHLSVMEQKFEDRYDFEEKISKILRNSNEQFDIILTFKFISEFYNRDYELNRGLYHSFIKQSYDYLTPEGMLIIEDVTNQIMENQKNNIFGERPLRADFALIRGTVTDKFGNTTYNGTTRTFNPMMAAAADYVIVGTCQVVEVGEIDPNNVVTSGIFVDAIVGGEKQWQI
jgi:SAM-dependent methyltransferase